MKRRLTRWPLAMLAAGLTLVLPCRAQPRVNEGSAILQTFGEAVTAYVKLRSTADSGLVPLRKGNKKGNILDHQRQLAERVRQSRADAKPGDIFTPVVAEEMRRLLGLAMQGGNAARVHASLRSAEPAPAALRINASFPEKLPMQSTPPTLLLNLPRLPPEIEYRLVGRTLVLRDSAANIVIDFMANALAARP